MMNFIYRIMSSFGMVTSNNNNSPPLMKTYFNNNELLREVVENIIFHKGVITGSNKLIEAGVDYRGRHYFTLVGETTVIVDRHSFLGHGEINVDSITITPFSQTFRKKISNVDDDTWLVESSNKPLLFSSTSSRELTSLQIHTLLKLLRLGGSECIDPFVCRIASVFRDSDDGVSVTRGDYVHVSISLADGASLPPYEDVDAIDDIEMCLDDKDFDTAPLGGLGDGVERLLDHHPSTNYSEFLMGV